MSTTALKYIPVLASEFTPSVLTSSADFVASRQLREYPADSLTNYSYEGNNVMQFTINSNDSFLDGRNSYIRFQLTATVTDAGLTADQLSKAYLDHCAHSFFSNFQIRLSNGTIIEDIQAYNKLYSIVRDYTMSTIHVDSVESILSGDGIQTIASSGGSAYLTGQPIVTIANASWVQATRILALGANGYFPAELRVGDLVQFATAGASYTGVIDSIPSASSVTLVVQNVAAPANIVAGNITSVILYNRTNNPSARNISAITANIRMKIKPFSNFLQNNKYLPLPFMKNLQLIFRLENPAYVIKVPQATAQTAITYSISNPKFVASLVQPTESLMSEYIKLYDSDIGISIPYISYFHSSKYQVAPAGTQQINIACRPRSARAVFTGIYGVYSESVQYNSFTNNTYSYNSISTRPKNNVSSYQYSVGSMRYPAYGVCETSDVSNGDAFQQSLMAFDMAGNTLLNTCLTPANYFARNTVVGQTNGVASSSATDSLKFLMGALLERQGTATGVDLSSDDLLLTLTFSAGGQDSYFRTWVIYDSLCNISKNSVIVMN